MKKALPVIFLVALCFAVYSGLSQAQNEISVGDVGEGDKMSVIDKQEVLNEADQIEQNVNNMLQLLEDLENSESLGGKLEAKGEEKNKSAEADPMDQFVKPDESSEPTQASQKKNKAASKIEATDEVVKFVPGDPDSHFRRGLDYWRSQNLDRAIHHFKETLRLDPENAHAYWNLGLLYEKKRDDDQAVDYITKAEAIYLKYGYSTYVEEAKKHLEDLSKKNKNPIAIPPLSD